MSFELPNGPGVYLIVGKNGSGKTTLLSCIDRIANPNVFANNFVKTLWNANCEVDSYVDTKIIYEVNDNTVEFTKGKKLEF